MKNTLLSIFMILISVVSYSQDYLITFAGAGASITIDSIQVENLTQNTSISIIGSNSLRLLGASTGTISSRDDSESGLIIFPNPTKGNSVIEFEAKIEGSAVFEIFDLSGSLIAQKEILVNNGIQSFEINELGRGVYIVRIKLENHIYTGKIISHSDSRSKVQIHSKDGLNRTINNNELKSTDNIITMYYADGDRMRYIGKSGNYRTIFTDIPIKSDTVTFNFFRCTDIDSNDYPIVTIGNQTWMATNLKVTRYFNGDDIETTNSANENLPPLSLAKYQWTYGDVNTYGRLYTWFVINDMRNVCPSGWHIPSSEDWATMEQYILQNGYTNDGLTIGNHYAKSLASTTGWYSSTIEGTVGNSDFSDKRNATGFTAVAGGFRYMYGSFTGLEQMGAWWTSTESTGRAISYNGDNVGVPYMDKRTGFSVRCIRNEVIENTNPPIATFTASDTSITEGFGTLFTDQSSNYPTIWEWDFGDGERSTLQNPGHGYTKCGKYTVQLTVSNEYGIDTKIITNYITVTKSASDYGTVTDNEGNVYNTIKISSQWWMSENLKATKYTNGDALPEVKDSTDWIALVDSGKAAYCWYDNNDTINKNIYGALYNSFAVNAGNLCPTGWHLPSDEEWTTMEFYIMLYNFDGSTYGNSYAKSLASSSGWKSSDENGAVGNTDYPNIRNATGFTALPGGYRMSYGPFYGDGESGIWWSSTAGDFGFLYHRGIAYYSTSVDRYTANPGQAHSIRCVMDSNF